VGEMATLLLVVLPEIEQGEEVGLLVPETAVQLVRPLAGLQGALPGILDGERRRDDQHLAQGALPLRLQDHAADAGVHRQPGEPPAERRDGGSTKGNRSTSPRPSRAICRITAARWVRRISGSVNGGRLRKSSSS